MKSQPSTTLFQHWQQNLLVTLPHLISVALLLLPLSIAASNVLLGVTLLFAIVSGGWLNGAKLLFQKAPLFSKVLVAYLALIPVGLLWSPDVGRGLVVLTKQWSWLLLPVMLVAFREKEHRERLLLFLSIGLGLHLLLSIAQGLGIPLPVKPPGGSSVGDPSGLIGHIGFGLLYGIWGTWLIQWGQQRHDKWRYLAWIVAAIAIAMVFIVQGRSGYLITIAVLVLMAWRLWLHQLNWWLLLSFGALFVAALVLLAVGPAKERLLWTIDSFEAIYHGDFRKAEPRWSLWYTAWEGWKQSPFIGVGTGGYPSTAEKIAKNNPDLYFTGHSLNPAHPHQMYLLDLVRWGPVGLLLLLTLLWQWFKLGKRSDWRENYTDSLISMMALGLAVHGLSAPSLEEYHGSIYATICLGLGLAAMNAGATDKKGA